jgi:membrane glycosyltransferase
MPWVYLVLALVLLAIPLKTSSVALAVVCVLAALVLLVLWVLGLLSSRIGARSRDESMMLDPRELQRLREQAEARRLTQQASPRETPPASGTE